MSLNEQEQTWQVTKILSQFTPTSQFTPFYGIRAAIASKAKEMDIPFDVILWTVGWKSDNKFRTFYDKPIIETVDMGTSLDV